MRFTPIVLLTAAAVSAQDLSALLSAATGAESELATMLTNSQYQSLISSATSAFNSVTSAVATNPALSSSLWGAASSYESYLSKVTGTNTGSSAPWNTGTVTTTSGSPVASDTSTGAGAVGIELKMMGVAGAAFLGTALLL